MILKRTMGRRGFTFRRRWRGARFLARVAGLVGCAAGLARAQDPAFDDFERATLGPNWDRRGSGAAIVNGHDLGIMNPTNSGLVAEWIGSVFLADQFGEVVIADAKPDTLLTQVYCRHRALDNARYGFHFNDENADGTGIGPFRWEFKYDGVPSAQTRILASVPAPGRPAPGDRLRLEVRGTDPVELRGFHNGALVLAAADAAHVRIKENGPPGVVSRARRSYTAPANSPVFASWRGGSLGPVVNIEKLDAGGGALRLSFLSMGNQLYTLQCMEILGSLNWSNVAALTGNGLTNSFSVTNAGPATRRFYRVRVN
jgi:hypothetical protein